MMQLIKCFIKIQTQIKMSQLRSPADPTYLPEPTRPRPKSSKYSFCETTKKNQTFNHDAITIDMITEKSSNIKVFSRFRPFNKVQTQLTINGFGTQSVNFVNDQTVELTQEGLVFTFDKIFPPFVNQSQVFEKIGKLTIQDVLNGYNGTIFAYGQTGSGKTHTMVGQIYDETLKGIVPRSISQIFEHIKQSEQEIQFSLTCSILEIYRENLYDLLSNHKDLKIKQSPLKGIYVQGLTEVSISTEKELYSVLELGQQSRKIASTRLNQNSSRSHTLFMIQIKQLLIDQSERRGKLNLVDLAGSQKVAKTGAVGCTLQQAKKINFSLSCLGNVIHALTNGSDYIPYRDSKLTRILSESIGGNFKTSIIVTCSTHSSSVQETISTLKFASRAKFIKNHYKMNIKSSPEEMEKIILQLRNELIETKMKLQKQVPIKNEIEEHQQAHQQIKDSEFYKHYKNPFQRHNSTKISYSLNKEPKISFIQSLVTPLNLKNQQNTQLVSLRQQIQALKKQNSDLKSLINRQEEEKFILKAMVSSCEVQKQYLTEKIKQKDEAYIRCLHLTKDLEALQRQIEKIKKQIFDKMAQNNVVNNQSRIARIQISNEAFQTYSIRYSGLRQSVDKIRGLKEIFINGQSNSYQQPITLQSQILKECIYLEILNAQIQFSIVRNFIQSQFRMLEDSQSHYSKAIIARLEVLYESEKQKNRVLLLELENRQQDTQKSRVTKRKDVTDVLNDNQKYKPYQFTIASLNQTIANIQIQNQQLYQRNQQLENKVVEFKKLYSLLDQRIKQYIVGQTRFISENLLKIQNLSKGRQVSQNNSKPVIKNALQHKNDNQESRKIEGSNKKPKTAEKQFFRYQYY